MKIVSMGAPNPASQTVLVVEDEVLVRMAVSHQLRDCGYNVVEAANADEALVVLEHHTADVQIVLSGVEMPGSMDGFALATWIRKNRPDLKVMLAASVSRAVKAVMELCSSGPLPGKYEPHTLLDRIRRLKATRAARKFFGRWREFTTRMRR